MRFRKRLFMDALDFVDRFVIATMHTAIRSLGLEPNVGQAHGC